VEERLAACCNIVPGVESVYRWKGEVAHDGEVLCIFKTEKALFKALRERVSGLHTYEVPEVIALDISEGDRGYLEWLEMACAGHSG